MPKFGVLALIMRITSVTIAQGVESLLGLVVVLSWGMGSILGLVQTRIKRLIAYSGISHVGWLIIALVVGHIIGYGSLMFYLFQYSANTALTLLTVIGLSYTYLMEPASKAPSANSPDIDTISGMSGLYGRSAVFAVSMVMALFSAAGIPPLVGFYAKLAVMQAMVFSSAYLYVVLGIVASIISAGFYLSVVSVLLFKDER